MDPRIAEIDRALGEAAEQGEAMLREIWQSLHPADQHRLENALRRRHKPRAQEVDQQRNS